jgi:hypothetical protein
MLLSHPTHAPQETPMAAAGRGLLAGLAATLLLSVLARALPGMSNQPGSGTGEEAGKQPPPPQDPFDERQVRQWQARAQSPAASRSAARSGGQQAGQPGATPTSALTLPQGPGPEGLAEQFAFKFVSGVFDVDISNVLRLSGMATHLVYGSAWGVLYGLLQASFRRPPGLFGALYGLLVWLVGPVVLVPAMRLLRPPWEEPPVRSSTLFAGHVAYGVALAAAFEALERGTEGAG